MRPERNQAAFFNEAVRRYGDFRRPSPNHALKKDHDSDGDQDDAENRQRTAGSIAGKNQDRDEGDKRNDQGEQRLEGVKPMKLGARDQALSVSNRSFDIRRHGSVVVRQQNFALALMVGLADHSVLFHPLDQTGRAIIADLQAPLDIGGRNLALARHDRDRFVVKSSPDPSPPVRPKSSSLVLILFLGDGVQIIRLTLRLQEPDHILNFGIGDRKVRVPAGCARPPSCKACRPAQAVAPRPVRPELCGSRFSRLPES